MTGATSASSPVTAGSICASARSADTSAAVTTRPTATRRRRYGATSHPIIRSFEPGENWYWCYVDDVEFELDVPPGPSHS